MTSAYIQQLRRIFKGMKKVKDTDVQEVSTAFEVFAEKNKKFEERKERASNDIRRGSRQSKGRIPD